MSAPECIYLQDAGDYSNAAAFEVTWCVEPQDDGDTEYIRADTVAEMIRQAVADAEAKALRRAAAVCVEYPVPIGCTKSAIELQSAILAMIPKEDEA